MMPNRGYKYATPGLRTRYRRENYNSTRANAYNGFKPWTREEDNAITAPDRPTDRETSAKIGRSVKAIQLRRNRLMKKTPEQQAVEWLGNAPVGDKLQVDVKEKDLPGFRNRMAAASRTAGRGVAVRVEDGKVTLVAKGWWT